MEIGTENCDITEKMAKKAAEWNPELSSRHRTNRATGRPRKRLEDDINDFFKQNLEVIEKDEPIERKIQNNTRQEHKPQSIEASKNNDRSKQTEHKLNFYTSRKMRHNSHNDNDNLCYNKPDFQNVNCLSRPTFLIPNCKDKLWFLTTYDDRPSKQPTLEFPQKELVHWWRALRGR